ncbi:MAG: cell wall hydrolase [Clostridia bacterium]|nr:cell wall hydrolase [Clostridia bacterium]
MNTCRKALLCIAAVMLSVVLLSFTCAASGNIGEPITLILNNTPVSGAVLIDDVSYVPFRNLVSTIDNYATFSWDARKNASVSDGTGVDIIAYAGENYIEANGRILYIPDVPNRNINGTLYVPVRSIAKAYTLSCKWKATEKIAHVTGLATPIMSGKEFYDSDDLYWLSRIISAESRGEPFKGQIAVGNVVLNRTSHGSFPDTVYGVIFDRKFGVQFSPAASGSVYKAPTESAVLAAKVALEGVEVVDALYFCTRRVSVGSWASRNREYCTTIGNHVFYY